MNSSELGVLIPIFVPLAFFAMIFGVVYVRSQEKRAMIERGMNPGDKSFTPINRNYVLNIALLLIGSGVGLLLAYGIDSIFIPPSEETDALYFSLIALFGGLGLFTAYLIEKKDTNKETDV